MKGKVLIVEDQADYRDLLKLHIQDDYQVLEADSGAALQKTLAQDQPDVVLLDVKLPDANGLGTCFRSSKSAGRRLKLLS